MADKITFIQEPRIAYKEFMQEEAQIRGGFIKKSRPVALGHLIDDKIIPDFKKTE